MFRDFYAMLLDLYALLWEIKKKKTYRYSIILTNIALYTEVFQNFGRFNRKNPHTTYI